MLTTRHNEVSSSVLCFQFNWDGLVKWRWGWCWESRARYMLIPSVYMQIGITGARRGDLKVYTCTCYSPIHKKCCHGSVVFQILLHLERSPTGDDFLAAEPHLHTRLRHVILTIALPLSSFPLIASFTTLLVRLIFFPHHCTAMK